MIRIPEHLRLLVPYVPGKPLEEVERQLGIRDAVKLASNENPLGPSPRAIEAIRNSASRVHRYPEGSGYALRRALSTKLGVPDSQIVLGNGSTELVEIIAKTFLARGQGAVVADRPTSAQDFLATACELIGIDHAKKNDTPTGRPIQIVEKPKPFTKLLAPYRSR